MGRGSSCACQITDKEQILKLSKTSLVLLVIGILVIAFGSLGAIRAYQINQHIRLSEELASAQLQLKKFQLDKLTYRQSELEQQLGQALSQFEAAEATLSQSVGSIATSSILFDIAAANGVEVTEVGSPGSASDSLGGVTCSVLTLTATVEGDVPNLIGFITQLNDDLKAGFVKSVDISIPEENSEEGEKPSANIQLLVYTYQGG